MQRRPPISSAGKQKQQIETLFNKIIKTYFLYFSLGNVSLIPPPPSPWVRWSGWLWRLDSPSPPFPRLHFPHNQKNTQIIFWTFLFAGSHPYIRLQCCPKKRWVILGVRFCFFFGPPSYRYTMNALRTKMKMVTIYSVNYQTYIKT